MNKEQILSRVKVRIASPLTDTSQSVPDCLHPNRAGLTSTYMPLQSSFCIFRSANGFSALHGLTLPSLVSPSVQ